MKDTIFWASASPEGGFDMGSEYNRLRLKQDLRQHTGSRYKIERVTPESNKQRRFFEGAVLPLIAYYQEGMHYENSSDLEKVREWLKIEFNGEMVVIKGKAIKVGGSTKGKLNTGFLERVIDWAESQGYQTELLNPAEYKHWHAAIFPFGGPDNYIDYLLELGKLKVV